MASLALSFNEVNFSPVQHNNQIWLTASELAKALGYAKSDAVTQIYERNKDEFTHEMTTTLKLSVVRKTGHVEMENRIFNSRGCHLITFFARTSVAKQFRKWVLDVLDKETSVSTAKTHKSEREPLTNAVNMLVAKTKHLNYSDAYKLVHQRFNVEHIEDIPYDSIPVAVEYVHYLIALYSNAPEYFETQNSKLETHAKNVAIHMYWVSAWWRCFGDSIRMLNPKMAGRIHDNFADGAFSAGLILGCDYSQELNAHILKELPYDLSESRRIDHFRCLQY
ncbi:BRO family, N-terminal domain protein [Acinetobacter sp. WC-323]|uniref:BRO-N domain-containing protein n=1 Tax=Acinetobacter sp. WC-323 TaxID=903918 RepID=UPI00029DDAFE|nr:BRO family protein [Acinetobacter sp. WC-323]EKU59506.1 BRO family, N-terminal domain protein [Acinetobacter sp. WC-323]